MDFDESRKKTELLLRYFEKAESKKVLKKASRFIRNLIKTVFENRPRCITYVYVVNEKRILRG